LAWGSSELHELIAHWLNRLPTKDRHMNARGKKILITLFAAAITVMLPAGCAFEAVPGIIGGSAVGPISGAGAAGGAGGAAGSGSGMVRGGINAGSMGGAGGTLPAPAR
jgi:hypothetical protein